MTLSHLITIARDLFQGHDWKTPWLKEIASPSHFPAVSCSWFAMTNKKDNGPIVTNYRPI